MNHWLAALAGVVFFAGSYLLLRNQLRGRIGCGGCMAREEINEPAENA